MGWGQVFIYIYTAALVRNIKKKRHRSSKFNRMIKCWKQPLVLMSASVYKDVPHIGLHTCIFHRDVYPPLTSPGNRSRKKKRVCVQVVCVFTLSLSSCPCIVVLRLPPLSESEWERQHCVYAKLWRTVGGADKQRGGNPIAQHKGELSDQGAESGVSSATNW